MAAFLSVAHSNVPRGQAYGSLVIVDPKVPDDDAMAPVRRLTPDQLFPESECATHCGPANYATAWALSKDFHLCVYDAFSRSNAGEANSYGVYLIDSFGNRDLIYRDPAIGYGSQKGARAILGTVPVESDGSASFLLPVNVPVCFQALDGDGLAVQAMRSATYVHPGETLTCQGCHEPRHVAPKSPPQTPIAMRRAPSRIQPEVEGSKPFSYPRLVQPVLDRQCVKCNAEKPKAFDLSAVT